MRGESERVSERHRRCDQETKRLCDTADSAGRGHEEGEDTKSMSQPSKIRVRRRQGLSDPGRTRVGAGWVRELQPAEAGAAALLVVNVMLWTFAGGEEGNRGIGGCKQIPI